MTTTVKDNLFTSPKVDFWFEDLINSIKLDHTLLQTGLASKEKEDIYSLLIEGNAIEILKKSRELSNQYFISKIIVDYVKLLAKDNNLPKKLAFDHSNSRVLVWAETESEAKEDALILAQAEVNAKYQEFGVYLTSSIVEIDDKLTVPAHYKELTNPV